MTAQTTSTDGTKRTPQRTRGSRLDRVGSFIESLPRPVAVSITVITVLGVWQAVVSFGGVSEVILPAPLSVAREVWIVATQLGSGGFLLGEFWTTVQEVLMGFAIAGVVGFLLGLWVGQTRFGQRAVMPLFVLIESSPKIAFTPVFIAWFGFGIASKFLMAAFMSVFPVIINTAAGMSATSEDEMRLFRSLGASRWDTFWKLKLKRALPFIFAGLKIAIVAAVTGAVAAEFIGGGVGFGEQIRVAAARIALDRVFALIMYLSVLGLVLFGLVSLAERRFAFWSSSSPRKKGRNT